MEFTQLIAQRYSCKNFGTGKVDAAALHTILEAGRLAPTAKNTQEQRIYVVQSEEGLAKIDAATPCRYGAPVCLVVAYDKNEGAGPLPNHSSRKPLSETVTFL